MITHSELTTALQRQSSAKASGKTLDLELVKQSGHVSRFRKYRVYLPKGYSAERSYPMLMVLHGCKQDHASIQAIAGFDAIADREQVIVVYPFVTTYSGLRNQNCWGWWLSRQIHRGRGEVSDLHRIAENVSNTYSVATNQRYVCGLSSGAAMSVVSLAAYSDFWTAGASVAGVPYGESSRSVRFVRHIPVRRKTVNALVRLLKRALVAPPPPLLVVQSEADNIVGPKLGANLRDSWLGASKCSAEANEIFEDSANDPTWQLTQYKDNDRLQVAHFLMSDQPHGWPGGLPGEYSLPDAPNVSELIWAFFAQHSKESA